MPLVCAINLGSDYILRIINLQLIIFREQLLESWLFLPTSKSHFVKLSFKLGGGM